MRTSTCGGYGFHSEVRQPVQPTSRLDPAAKVGRGRGIYQGACALPGFGLRPGWRRRILALANVIQSPARHASRNGSGYEIEGPPGLGIDATSYYSCTIT